jgi:hypothetical protein
MFTTPSGLLRVGRAVARFPSRAPKKPGRSPLAETTALTMLPRACMAIAIMPWPAARRGPGWRGIIVGLLLRVSVIGGVRLLSGHRVVKSLRFFPHDAAPDEALK